MNDIKTSKNRLEFILALEEARKNKIQEILIQRKVETLDVLRLQSESLYIITAVERALLNHITHPTDIELEEAEAMFEFLYDYFHYNCIVGLKESEVIEAYEKKLNEFVTQEPEKIIPIDDPNLDKDYALALDFEDIVMDTSQQLFHKAYAQYEEHQLEYHEFIQFAFVVQFVEDYLIFSVPNPKDEDVAYLRNKSFSFIGEFLEKPLDIPALDFETAYNDYQSGILI